MSIKIIIEGNISQAKKQQIKKEWERILQLNDKELPIKPLNEVIEFKKKK